MPWFPPVPKPVSDSSLEKQLLIVDHSSSRRASLKSLLVQQHYSVLEATSCEQALGLMARTPAPIILTDTELPTKSGLFLLQRVKQDFPESEVILLTHNASSYNLLQALRLGAYDFIVRPIDTGDILFNALERAFQAVDLRCENRRLIQELKKKNQLLSSSLRMTQALNSSIERLATTLDVSELLKELLNTATSQLQSAKGLLALSNPARGDFGIKVSKGVPASFSHACYKSIPPGLVSRMIERGKPVLVPDALPARLAELGNSLELSGLINVPGLLAAPLCREGRQIGMLALFGHPEHRPFCQDDLQFLLQLSHHAALALEKAGLIRKLQQNQKDIAQ